MSTQTLAERLARHFHADQTDKAGKPYIQHLERVVGNLLRRWPDATDEEVAAAWLHDAIEDTGCTANSLRVAGVPESTILTVLELTIRHGASYLDQIRDLAEAGSDAAVRVKLADNEDNSSPERVAAIPGGRVLLEKRYKPARALLEARIRL